MCYIEGCYVQNEGIEGVDTPTLMKGGNGGEYATRLECRSKQTMIVVYPLA